MFFGDVQSGQHHLDVACVLLDMDRNLPDPRTGVLPEASDLVHVSLVNSEGPSAWADTVQRPDASVNVRRAKRLQQAVWRLES